MHLHAQRGDLQAHFRAVALHERHHEFVERGVVRAHLRVRVVVRRVVGGGGHAGHGAAALGEGAHGHEHAAHVGVVDDGRAAPDAAVHGAALHALARVLHGVLVGALGHRDALHAHGVARGVHHDEHVLQAAVLLADQIPDGAAVVAILQHGRGRSLDAHLVLDAHAVHIVARAQAAVLVHHELGHHEQADALDALGSARHARQHQVHDVLGHVVLAVGDEDLGAEDLVRAVRLRLGAAAHQRQVGAGLGLGEVHRAGPLAGNELFQVGGLELVAARGEQRLDSAVGQQRAQREAQVGAVEHLAAGRADGLGQPLAAKVGRVLQALPAALGELAESLLEAGRGGDRAVLEP